MPRGRRDYLKFGIRKTFASCPFCDYETESETGYRLHLKMSHHLNFARGEISKKDSTTSFHCWVCKKLQKDCVCPRHT